MTDHSPTDLVEKKGWFADLMSGASKAFAFGRAPVEGPAARASTPPRRSAAADLRGKSAEVHRLAGEGLSRSEIARRLGLAQDTVALLLHLAPREPVDSAARGTFFRILQTRMAS